MGPLFIIATSLLVPPPVAISGFQLPVAPKIDGTIDEESEWAGCPSSSETYEIITGTPASLRSRFWVSYGKDAIYFAARMDDPEPQRIRATQKHTNASFSGDDVVALAIAPFGPTSAASRFIINPLGTSSVRLAGGSASKLEWQGEIQSAARITPTGWECEAKIPWSLMRLPKAGVQELGLNFSRRFARDSRNFVWKYTRDDDANYLGRWTGVEVPAQKVCRTVELLPFGYLGGGEKSGAIANAGVDFRTQLTDRIGLVGTLNPDFRNIEQSVLSLDFSYFERLASESRPFFSEGEQYFESAPFASQRIRTFDGGIKAFGPLNNQTTFGFLNTLDFGEESASVISISHRANQRSGIGFGATVLDTPTRKNNVAQIALDTSSGAYYVSASGSTTNDSASGTGASFGLGSGYSYKRFNFGTGYSQTTDGFDPALGYVSETGVASSYASIGTSQDTPTRWIRSLNASVGVNESHFLDGTPHSRSVSLGSYLSLRSDTSLSVSFDRSRFDDNEDQTAYFGITRGTSDSRRNWSLYATAGDLAGHAYRNVGGSVRYRPWRDIQLSGSVQHVSHFEDANLVQLSGTWDLMKDWSVSGRVVIRESDIGGYLTLKRAGNRGVEYFVILGDPGSPTFRTSLVLKAVVPLRLGR